MDGLIRYDERRAQPRREVNSVGTIPGSSNATLISVKIRDLSSTGAGLEVTAPEQVPDTFDLLIPEEGLIYRVVVRWRKGRRLGVEFIGEPRTASFLR